MSVPRLKSVLATNYAESVSDAPPPPGPPPAPPPSPTPGTPPRPDTAESASGIADHDNPIAIAGIIVAVLALVLSIIVIGGLIGIVSFVLCVIGLRRARRGKRGRGLAITGIVVSLLSILFSAVAVVFLVALVRSGDEIVRDGIITTSDNTEYPPQDDIDGIECSASNSGRIAQATVTITNRSTGPSVYRITIEWETNGEPIEEIVSTDYLDAGESASYEAVDLSGRAMEDSCRVTRIERSFLPILF